MKKLTYFCGMMLLSLNMMAQIDLDDPNWEQVFYDDFTNNYWDTWDNWEITHPVPVGHYYSYLKESTSGITHGPNEHQIYQRGNCQFENGELWLVSEYKGGPDMLPINCLDYDLPPGKIGDSQHQTLFYTSGNIQTTTKFLYGYFEIRCSLPTHIGSFPAFWLYSQGDDYYNEIDIFEYSTGVDPNHTYKSYTCGIYCDNTHPAPEDFDDISQARVEPNLSSDSEDLSHFHTFACEWLPECVTWYIDGNVVNEYSNYDSIPHHEMTLKVNYAINNYALTHNQNMPIWCESDTMRVDYIKVYHLDGDCDSDVLITSVQGLMNYQPSVKHSMTIEPANNFTVPLNANVSMMAIDSIVIEKGFALPQGARMTLQTRHCPE